MTISYFSVQLVDLQVLFPTLLFVLNSNSFLAVDFYLPYVVVCSASFLLVRVLLASWVVVWSNACASKTLSPLGSCTTTFSPSIELKVNGPSHFPGLALYTKILDPGQSFCITTACSFAFGPDGVPQRERYPPSCFLSFCCLSRLIDSLLSS